MLDIDSKYIDKNNRLILSELLNDVIEQPDNKIHVLWKHVTSFRDIIIFYAPHVIEFNYWNIETDCANISNEWFRDNIKEVWALWPINLNHSHSIYNIYFRNPDDLMMFKIRWL